MRYLFIILLLFFSSSSKSQDNFLKINTEVFLDKINKYREDEKFLYKNKETSLNSPQLYFLKDGGGSFGGFDKQVMEYGFVDMGAEIDYIYAEHFFDCKSKNKIIYRQIFDKDGRYLKSHVSYYKFKDSSLKLDQIICSIN